MPRRAISLEDINTVSAIHHALLGQEEDQDEDQDQDQDLDNEQGHHRHEQYPDHNYRHHHQEQNHSERPASVTFMSLAAPVSSDTLPSSLRHSTQHLHLHQPQPQSPQYLRSSLHPRNPLSSYNILHDRPQSALSLREHENLHGPQYPLYRLDHDHHRHHHHHQLQSPIWPLTPDQEPEELLTPGIDSGSLHYHHHQHHLPHGTLDNTSPVDNGGGEQTAGDDSGQDKDLQEQGHTNVNTNTNTNTIAGPLGWLNASPLLDALIGWVEGPPHQPQLKKNEKPNPMLDIPFQFIALLTYPEPDPKLGNKMTLAMVRETAFVRQRRKTLLMLTLYTLVVRYCSFDFFLAVLFASNCGMLFLMKNSGRMNVTMAKRAVGQRVGWAKQWAGGLFRRGTSNNGNHQGLEPGIQQQQQQQQQQGSTYSNLCPSKSMPSLSTPLAGGRIGTPPILGEKLDSIQDGNQQTRRRGLFGKRKTPTTTTNNNNNNNNSNNSSNSVAHHGTSILGSFMDGAGDDVSVLTGRTQRRGFFKRNTTLATSTSRSIISSSAPTSDPISLTRTFVPSILTTRPSTAMSTPPLSQTKPMHQHTTHPARSPSPCAMRKDSSQTQARTNSPPTSGSSSSSSSPKAILSPNITTPSSIRSLSSINPRSFLSGFSQSQKQSSSQASSQPTSTSSLLSHLKNSTNVATTIPIPISSPQPVNATTAHSTFLSQSLTNSRDPMTVSMAGGSIVVFEDEIIEYSDSHSDLTPSHRSKFSCSPEPLVRLSSDNSSNCSGNGNGSVRSSSSSNASGGSGISHLDHRPQQLQLQLQHQDQQSWPKENNNNNNNNDNTTNSNSNSNSSSSSSSSGVALLLERAKLKRMSSGLSFMMNKDELDPVSSVAAETMEGFDREV